MLSCIYKFVCNFSCVFSFDLYTSWHANWHLRSYVGPRISQGAIVWKSGRHIVKLTGSWGGGRRAEVSVMFPIPYSREYPLTLTNLQISPSPVSPQPTSHLLPSPHELLSPLPRPGQKTYLIKDEVPRWVTAPLIWGRIPVSFLERKCPQ